MTHWPALVFPLAFPLAGLAEMDAALHRAFERGKDTQAEPPHPLDPPPSSAETPMYLVAQVPAGGAEGARLGILARRETTSYTAFLGQAQAGRAPVDEGQGALALAKAKALANANAPRTQAHDVAAKKQAFVAKIDITYEEHR